MKNYFIALITCLSFLIVSSSFAQQNQQTSYVLEHADDVIKTEPGPHEGGGSTTVYNYFTKAENSRLVFRKRILHQGAAIGYHLQKDEEIYYIVSGTGEMKMNDKTFMVKTGDAILTFAGSSHGLKQTGTDDLIIIINYEK